MVFEEKTVSGRWPQIEALCHWGILGLVILCVIVNGLTGWGGAVFESLRENDKLGHAFFFWVSLVFNSSCFDAAGDLCHGTGHRRGPFGYLLIGNY